MPDFLRPDTAPVPAGLSVSGWVCVDPDGVSRWSTARGAPDESIAACFAWAGPYRLDTRARDGWRCVPITLTTLTPHPAAPPTDGPDYVAIGSERHFAEVTRADGADRDGGEA